MQDMHGIRIPFSSLKTNAATKQHFPSETARDVPSYRHSVVLISSTCDICQFLDGHSEEASILERDRL